MSNIAEVLVVDTVAELRTADTIGAAMTAYRKAFGGRWYYWDENCALPDNGTTIVRNPARNLILGEGCWRAKNIPEKYVDTYASLRSLATDNTTKIVYVLGHDSIADGGQGTFIWSPTSTAADNNGTIIAPSGGGTGRWLRDSSVGGLCVTWFGAVGDGVTDDYAAITDTISALGTGGGTIIFPGGEENSPKEYIVNASITIDENVYVLILPGAILNGTGDIEFNSAKNLLAEPTQQISSGLAISFAIGGEGYPGWWIDSGDGSVGNPWACSLDNVGGLQEAADSNLTHIIAVDGYYEIDGSTKLIEYRPFITINSISTSGTGEDDLITYNLPQYSYLINKAIRITAAGTKTGGAGNKTVKLYIGTTTITFNPAANDTNDWRIEAIVQLFASDEQRITWLGFNGATPLQNYEVGTDDMSTNDLNIKCTGECSDAADTITQTLLYIEAL